LKQLCNKVWSNAFWGSFQNSKIQISPCEPHIQAEAYHALMYGTMWQIEPIFAFLINQPIGHLLQNNFFAFGSISSYILAMRIILTNIIFTFSPFS
jgi:hypothetical protein